MAGAHPLESTPASPAAHAAHLAPIRRGHPLLLAVFALLFPVVLITITLLFDVVEEALGYGAVPVVKATFVLLALVAVPMPFAAVFFAARARRLLAPDERARRHLASAVVVLAILEVFTVVPFMGCGALYVWDA